MKSKFLLLTLFCIPIFLQAQWESLGDNIVPLGHRAWSIKMAPDESIWVISTFDNFPPTGEVPKVHRSADGGLTWVDSELPAAMNTYGWDISPVDSNLAYVALDTAGLYKTIDGGGSWTQVDSFLPYSTVYVHFFDANDGWVLAVDTIGALVISVTADGGNTWLDASYISGIPPGMSLPSSDLAESIAPIAYSVSSAYDYSDESIILGTTTGKYWVSNDKGYNWERYESPLVGLERWTTNVTMKDSTTFMLSSDYNPAIGGTPNKSFTTTDGGNTWIEGNPGVTAAASHYLGDSTFIMTGHRNFGGGPQGTAITYDYGATWEKLDNSSILAIDFLDKNTGVGVCCNLSPWPQANGQVHKWNFDFPTAIKDILSTSEIRLMPNPVSDILTIKVGESFDKNQLSFEIISLDGKILKSWKSNVMDKTEIDVYDLPNGFYVLKIMGKERIVSRKFIKN